MPTLAYNNTGEKERDLWKYFFSSLFLDGDYD